ncbi:uncharacterized protein LOC120132964 [Hibiscus syriacus]|uniref:uncharacterized protein LOC120132964 n=1 Tax=Hibiscus syriacus TaxID=106335 RepID=UPI001921E65F|nr:uncharacterized protein LOC120132964 [Hibiscus syriacus]
MINTDGSREESNDLSSCGGAVRNHEETWLMRFKKFLGTCSILEAELCGVYVDLHWARDTNLRRVIIENDNLNVINMQQNHKRKSNLLTIVDHIYCLLDRDWEVRF